MNIKEIVNCLDNCAKENEETRSVILIATEMISEKRNENKSFTKVEREYSNSCAFIGKNDNIKAGFEAAINKKGSPLKNLVCDALLSDIASKFEDLAKNLETEIEKEESHE